MKFFILDMKLSDFLVRYRETAKEKFSEKTYSAALVAWGIGVDKERYSKWEQGATPMDAGDIRKLEQFFGISDLWNIPNSFLGTAFTDDRPSASRINKEEFKNSKGAQLPIRSNAFPLGAIDDEATETNKSGNEFIDIGQGKYVMLVPLVHEYAFGGYVSGFQDASFIKGLPKTSIIVSAQHKGVYRAFEVRGESMESGDDRAINEGDIVIGRLIDQVHWKSRFHIHKFKEYVIVHNEGIIVKEIIGHNVEEGIITCHSTNPDQSKHTDFNIYLADVKQIFNVTQVIKIR